MQANSASTDVGHDGHAADGGGASEGVQTEPNGDRMDEKQLAGKGEREVSTCGDAAAAAGLGPAVVVVWERKRDGGFPGE